MKRPGEAGWGVHVATVLPHASRPHVKPPDPTEGHPTGSSTRTVERALALLAEVCANEHVSLAQCARRTGLPPSTALRLLRTLEASAFVSRDVDGCFHPGARLIQLGAAAFGRQSLATLAEPALRRIVAECGETAYLYIPGPADSALTVAMVEGTYAVRHASWVGRSIEVEGTAIGRAFAGGADGYAAGVPPREPDVTEVCAAIARPLGSRSAQAIADGAVPAVGAVLAVISVVGPTYRLDEARVQALGEVVRREALGVAREFVSAENRPVGPASTAHCADRAAEREEVTGP